MDQPIFNINGEDLTLEKIFFEDGCEYVFFLFKSDTKMYFVLCLDDENISFYASSVEQKLLDKLLTKKITARKAIKKGKEKYLIRTGNNLEDDTVIKVPSFDKFFLPDKKYHFDEYNGSISDFAEFVRKKYETYEDCI